MIALLRLLARFPLAWLHRIGAALGWFVYIASPVYAARMRENLAASGIYADNEGFERALKENIVETGKGAMEVAKVWFDDLGNVTRLVECTTWNVVEEAQREGRG